MDNKSYFERVFRYKTFYHITHIDNLINIKHEKRIFSNMFVKHYGFDVNRIDDPSINIRRGKRIIKSGRTLDKFVPFLMNPRGPFLKRITQNGELQNVVMLGAKYQIPSMEYYFSDGNSFSSKTKFYDNLLDLEEKVDVKLLNKDWNDVLISYSISDEVGDELKRQYQAEVLMFLKVHLSDLSHIVVPNEQIKQFVDKLNLGLESYVVPQMFF